MLSKLFIKYMIVSESIENFFNAITRTFNNPVIEETSYFKMAFEYDEIIDVSFYICSSVATYGDVYGIMHYIQYTEDCLSFFLPTYQAGDLENYLEAKGLEFGVDFDLGDKDEDKFIDENGEVDFDQEGIPDEIYVLIDIDNYDDVDGLADEISRRFELLSDYTEMSCALLTSKTEEYIAK